MTTSQDDITWTIKIDKKMDQSVQKVLKQLGYKSKAEFTREAIREFLIRRNLYSLLGGDVSIPITFKNDPDQALQSLIDNLEKVPKEILREEIKLAREDVQKELLNDG